MWSRFARRWCPATLILALATPTPILAGADPTRSRDLGDPCDFRWVSVDTTFATARDGPVGGEAVGQAFFARDSVIRTISVWRAVPPVQSGTGLQLVLMGVNPDGGPETSDVLRVSPPVFSQGGDGQQPIEFRYVFDPPVVLPSRGRYFFAIQPHPCTESFQLLLNDANVYHDGETWLLLRGVGPYCTYSDAARFPSIDLIFGVEYQRPSPTQIAVTSVEAETCSVRLAWTSVRDSALAATVFRRSGAGVWKPLAALTADANGRFEYLDSEVVPGVTYDYRLGVDKCDRLDLYGEIAVVPPGDPGVTLARADAGSAEVHLRWSSLPGRVLAATLYRRSPASAWKTLGSLDPDASGDMSYEDRDVSPGARYEYRLGVILCGREAFFGEASVEIPRLALVGLGPTPSTGDLRVTFSLLDDGPAQLEVMDLTGRRVLLRQVGGLGPGSHALDIAESRGLSPGVYLVRLTQGRHSFTARGIIVR